MRFQAGDKIRLTGDFLRNTGQIAGGEGQSRWIVQACPCPACKAGRFVLTDELRPHDGMFTNDELARDPYLLYRHLHAANVERCRS